MRRITASYWPVTHLAQKPRRALAFRQRGFHNILMMTVWRLSFSLAPFGPGLAADWPPYRGRIFLDVSLKYSD